MDERGTGQQDTQPPVADNPRDLPTIEEGQDEDYDDDGVMPVTSEVPEYDTPMTAPRKFAPRQRELEG